MTIKTRLEDKSEYRAVEELTREAFWGYLGASCDEHYLVHRLRNTQAFVAELDFVATADGVLVGNVMYSKAKVVGENGKAAEVLTFGPLSVHPDFRNAGVGARLMRVSIIRARELGYRGIVFFGHPDYYPRFGFQNAKVFGITTADGDNYDSLMAMELQDGGFDGIHGRFFEDPVFECDKDKVALFDAEFPKKEPAVMASADELIRELSSPSREILAGKRLPCLAWLSRISGRELIAWGMDERSIATVSSVLKKHGYGEKLLPECEILKKAKSGINVLFC